MAPYTIPFIIDGEERFAKETYEVKSPETGEVVTLCGAATVSDANAAVEAAAAAAASWRDTSNSTRRDIFLRAADIMDKKREELGRYLEEETGQPHGWSEFNLNNGIDMVKDAAGRISTLGGYVPRPANPETNAMIWQEPYGVVFAIAPW